MSNKNIHIFVTTCSPRITPRIAETTDEALVWPRVDSLGRGAARRTSRNQNVDGAIFYVDVDVVEINQRLSLYA